MTRIRHITGEGGDISIPDEHAQRFVKSGRWQLAEGEVMPKISVQAPTKTQAAPWTKTIVADFDVAIQSSSAAKEMPKAGEQKKGAAAGDGEGI